MSAVFRVVAWVRANPRGALPWMLAILVLGSIVFGRMVTLPTRRYDWLDGYVYVEAARTVLTNPAQLYQAAMQQLHHDEALRAYIYPPSGLLPFLPLGWLALHTNEQIAASVWLVWDTCALAGSVVFLGRALGASWERIGWMLLAASIAGPVITNIVSLQVNGTVVLLFALVCRWYPHPRAGVALGLMLALKPVLPLLLLYPLLRGRPRIAGLGLVTVVGLNLAFLPWVGVEQARFYAFDFLPYASSHIILDVDNLSVASLLQVWVGGRAIGPHGGVVSPLHAAALATALTWVIRLTLLGVWLVAVRRSRASDLTLLCLTLGLVPIFTATVWPHYFTLLLPLLMLGMCSSAPWVQRTAWLVVPALLAGGHFWVMDISRPQSWGETVGYVRGMLIVSLSVGATAWALATQARGRAPQVARVSLVKV